MRKRLLLLALSCLVLSGIAKPAFPPPNEGMWLPLLISQNFDEMQRLGFKLKPDDIYSVNKSSLKDAIVSFGGFCTAEIISDQGLLLTNHHCAYDAIQSHTSVENNYLRDGFWAKTKAEEKPVAGLTISILNRMEDVTKRVLAEVGNAPEAERPAKIKAATDAITKEATQNGKYTAYVRDMFGGNEFFLFVFEVYRDIRLVGAPPEAIGKFGGDTDNWMWPRHTGDFSLLRIYADKDNNPADYSPTNVPYKPKHFLPINIGGVKPGDFAMVFGFPGRTTRYLTAEQIKISYEITNPARVKLRDKRLATMKEDMDADPAIRIKYASKYASIANYWKYFIGQNKGITRLDLIEEKLKNEQAFLAKVNADPNLKSKYGSVIQNIADAAEKFKQVALSTVYISEAGLAPEAVALANRASQIYSLLAAKQPTNQAIATLKASLDEHFKNYNLSTDKKLFARMLKMYYTDIPKDQQPELFQKMNDKYKGDFFKWANEAYAKTAFADKAKLEAFLAKPNKAAFDKDAIFIVARAIMENYNKKIVPVVSEYFSTVSTNHRLYVAAQREIYKEKRFYPDANSTLRVSYGTVMSYDPMDCVKYDFETKIEGIAEKEDPRNEEFIVPKKLMDLYRAKDYGPYGKNGTLTVNFITDNDITGGNSGSPVINGNGELIGIAFDGNWEGMAGDIAFDPKLKRTINCDIRYVLFVVDKFAGATHLLQEMKIVGQ